MATMASSSLFLILPFVCRFSTIFAIQTLSQTLLHVQNFFIFIKDWFLHFYLFLSSNNSHSILMCFLILIRDCWQVLNFYFLVRGILHYDCINLLVCLLVIRKTLPVNTFTANVKLAAFATWIAKLKFFVLKSVITAVTGSKVVFTHSVIRITDLYFKLVTLATVYTIFT